jgi:hypothetical protein
VVYNLASRFVVGRLGFASPMAVSRRGRELLLRFASGGRLDDGSLGSRSCFLGGGCRRSRPATVVACRVFVLLLCSDCPAALDFMFDGGGHWSGAILRELYRLAGGSSSIGVFVGGGGGCGWGGSPFGFLCSARRACDRRWPLWFWVTGGLFGDGRFDSSPINLGGVVAVLGDSASRLAGGRCSRVIRSFPLLL